MQPLPSQPSQSEIPDDECWRLLAGQKVGRLATSVAGEPEIFPVNFAVADHRVYLRTKPGTKLAEITLSPRVALEVDEIGEDSAWSVVLKGHARALRSEKDIADAQATGLSSYLEDGKTEWIRIVASDISGRRLIPGEA
ncbi:pyridoxamine 5'-phosphate oxidase family protein [Isoptericola sp. NEAU-Y5]|uniref:Pyridoxamine 5'-phosphate oxidase family protein n=1 Tax=Isoptericola luteus TaxID=2879484 RepID=A0ABS7ZHP2_9MICO|nr:pyridoxamine 5'-phosphate oxidase family protein [Isoptericola sp. NEAU-Y5]MCA5893982.1 pyridoxamine 5'-phosphate oxidase family protein [Isoptericola sp. NEAU-Y5]